MPKSLYLIDGHAQIYRAYYAPFGNLTSPTGEPTRAVHVFSQMLINLLKNKRPDYLAVALDVSDLTLQRKQIYPEYKAHRDPAPEDFEPQERRILQILSAARIPMLRIEGWEADDILATLARRFAGPEMQVVFVSRDKDLDQLLSPSVSMYDPNKDELLTHDRLSAVKGWTPAQAIDAQTLIGDTVDNVPGVPGIGPKTAAKLLQKYGSAAAVVAHADELTPKQRENVLAFAPHMDRTRQLVTLRTDAPVVFDIEAARPENFDWDAARAIFDSLGMRKLPEQLPAGQRPAAGAAPVAAPAPASALAAPAMTLFDVDRAPGATQTSGAASASAPPAETAGVVVFGSAGPGLSAAASALRVPDGGDYVLVNTPEQLDALLAQLARQPAFAVDTETTSVSPVDADLVGVSLAWEVGRGYYIPVRCALGGALSPELVRDKLAPLLANPTTQKVGHNLKYDVIVLAGAGMPVAGPLFDTMIAAFALDPARSSYGMDALIHALLGHEMIPITDLIGKGRDQLRMDQAPLPAIAEYAAEDADYTWRMRRLFEPLLAPAGVDALFHETEMPLVSVLAEMETHGIRLDVPFLREMGQRLARRMGELIDEIHHLAGTRFNPDSPKQLAEVLFDRMNFRVVRTTRTARSTDAETLETLAAETEHPLLGRLLEYRELQKLCGTYVEALPGCVSKRTGRVHTSFHQTGAITGRLSSSEPNLQNIPIRTELGREIRRAFIPRSPDELLVVADYSQVELRVLAHFSEDEALCRAFAEDRDIHAVVAAQVNGVALEAVTREMRARAKAVNFGIIYGQTAFGLAQATGMGRGEAQRFIDEYFKRYPRIRAFIDRCVQDARRDGFVRTILGRRRPIQNIDSQNRVARAQAERFAVNTVVQGSAADLIKTAMIRLHARIHAESLPLRMLLQVHDELVCEAPRERAAEMAEALRSVMSGAMTLRVPLKADAAIGENWLEAK